MTPEKIEQLKQINRACVAIAEEINLAGLEQGKDLFVNINPFRQIRDQQGCLQVWSLGEDLDYRDADVWLTLDARGGYLASVSWKTSATTKEFRVATTSEFYDLACTIVGGC